MLGLPHNGIPFKILTPKPFDLDMFPSLGTTIKPLASYVIFYTDAERTQKSGHTTKSDGGYTQDPRP